MKAVRPSRFFLVSVALLLVATFTLLLHVLEIRRAGWLEAYLPPARLVSLPEFTLRLRRLGSRDVVGSRELFPWATDTFQELLGERTESDARGIVISASDAYVPYARHLILTLRRVHNCTLPVTVAFCGHRDLSTRSRRILGGLHKVEAVDICTPLYLDNSELRLSGYTVKPYAHLLAGRYRHAILLDADAVLLRDPSFLFESDQYTATGAIFFRDRSVSREKCPKRKAFFDAIFGHGLVPESVKALRIYRLESGDEQESGMVVIDRKRHLKSLLGACKLVGHPYDRRRFYSSFHGDKEAFWLGAEMAQTRYSWGEDQCGGVGRVVDGSLCGHILHFEPGTTKPFWFNGSIRQSRHGPDAPGNFSHYSSGGTWELKDSCNHGAGITAMDGQQVSTMNAIASLYRTKKQVDDILL